MIHYPHNLMRGPKYRIEEFKGEFTIEKRFLDKKWSSLFPVRSWFFDFLFAYSYTELYYKALSEDDSWDEDLILGKIQIFNSLKEAKAKLKQIISQTEVKYHNF